MKRSLFEEIKQGLIEAIKSVKTRKHFSRPSRTHKPKKGKGSYKRNKRYKYGY